MDRERECLHRVQSWRWPEGIRCPRCGGKRIRIHKGPGASGRKKYFCPGCRRTFSDLTGTPFARSRLPLWKWFECAHRILSGKVTCAELAGRVKVKVATTWRIRGVLNRALLNPEFRSLFEGENP